MKALRFIRMVLLAIPLCANFSSCSDEEDYEKWGRYQYDESVKIAEKWVTPVSFALDIVSYPYSGCIVSTNRSEVEAYIGEYHNKAEEDYAQNMDYYCSLCDCDVIVGNLSPNTTYYIMPYYSPNNQGKPTAQYLKGDIIEITTPNEETWTEEIVDLGLNIKWRGRNLNAETPCSTGSFYIWGNTEPTTYTNTNMSYSPNPPSIKLENICGTEYDAATVNLGENWRLPTYNDVHELLNNTTCTANYANGKIIYDFKSNINGEHLYIPGSAYIPYTVKDYGNGNLSITGIAWSNDVSEDDVPYFWVGDSADSGDYRWCLKGEELSLSERYWGLPIRPVYDENKSNTGN